MREMYLKEGFCDYLSKPIDHVQLENMLLRYLPENLIQYTDEEGEKVTEMEQNEMQGKEEITKGGGLDALRQWEPGLDVEKALGFCGGSEEFYLELLRDFANDNKLQKLIELYEKKDWKNYAVVIHALKGVSRTLGFAELGDMSEMLQKAAEAENESILQENHTRMLEKYRHVLEGIDYTV